MNFAELRFWALLLSGIAVVLLGKLFCAAVRPASLISYDRSALLLLGWSMLLAVSWLTFVIFISVKFASYFGLRWILSRRRGRKRYLAVLVPLVLTPLLYYKYARFAGGIVGWQFDSLQDVVIPVGISFYTFQAVAFLVDTLGFSQPLPRFRDFMNFAGFFPQIVAGPIERRADLLPQMELFQFRWNAADIDAGVSWIVVGLFFKMALADNLATHFDPTSTVNPFLIWKCNVIFGLRVYFDFAGYSLVAIGLARCLGVNLTLNFASPYCSRNITEFWRRWHITLSQWFRDYVYLPLGGARTRLWWLNVMAVFVLSGLWHGAGWNFIAWGALNGLFLIVHRLFSRAFRLPRFVGWGLTMIGTFVAWLCFYETRTSVLLAKIRTLFDPFAYDAVAWREAYRSLATPNGFVLLCFLALASIALLLERRSLEGLENPYALFRKNWVLVTLVILTVLLAPAKNNAFIYFAF